MSLRSVVEIVTHVESFRNVDLYYQGVYFLRITIHNDAPQDINKIYAHPHDPCESYKTYPQEAQQNVNPPKYYETHIFRPASIVTSNSAFYTKAFFIKFCEEEIELNDICNFRIEFDAGPKKEQSLIMQVDLMFFDCLNSQKDQPKQEPLYTKQDKEDYAIPDGKIQATAKFKIKNVLQPNHQFVPIIFEEQNFCQANMVVHTITLDYRFRTHPIQLFQFARLKFEERNQLLEGKVPNTLDKNKNQSKPLINSDQISMYETIQKQFKELKGLDYYGMQQEFVESLKGYYEQLYQHYNLIYSKCILEKQRKHFKKYLYPPLKLIVPEYITSETYQNIKGQLTRKELNQRIEEKFHTSDPETIIHSILNETNLISCQLFQMWIKVLDLYRISPRFCVALLQFDYQKIIKNRWQQFCVRSPFQQLLDKNLGIEHKSKSEKMRQESKVQELGVEDLNSYPKIETQPIIFEEFTPREDKDKNEENIVDADITNSEYDIMSYRGIHLIVLVHGFQGNSYDMKLFKNYISLAHPEAMFLCSSINEENTEGNIQEMGEKLATEVINFISENCPENTLGRLSFIGHSLGGVIIRASLPYLDKYQDKMYTYISLSSPQLGYFYNASKIVDAGMWVLKQWRKSKCLEQLQMTDNRNIEETCLQKLAQAKGLAWFKNVCFFSCIQDSYAPYDSARVQLSKEAIEDQRNKPYVQMVKALLRHLENTNVYRIDVNFEIQEKNLDTLIGRTAHIQFLECQPLLRMVVSLYDQFFC
ncbi:unnamed protein product [Paramecium sonneborni]|uniref:DUF676 domain-containing protein n=1 Tax=Paramecium sonneborni TaxID=65129 RepID=A0A8S1NUR0_9CILI|nr:unnamed protein product [Paramecium sonneborni]